jgi:histone deacetylase 11
VLQIAYHPGYNIHFLGVERLHPFDSRKYGRAWAVLREQFGRALNRYRLRVDRPATEAELLAVHASEYLAKLRSSAYLAQALEVPPVRRIPNWLLRWRVLRPMRLAARGSVLAAKAALKHGLAVNLSGGYHHAKPDRGEGFCIYSDIALIAHQLRAERLIGEADRIVYIDLDVHQGNSVCYHFRDDRRVFLFDVYDPLIYTYYDLPAKGRIDCNLPVPLNCTGPEYWALLTRHLPGFLDSVGRSERVALAIYNAGTDVFADDPLGGMYLSADDIFARDLYVVEQARSRGIPLVMLPSGGYTRVSYQLIARSVAELVRRYGEP